MRVPEKKAPETKRGVRSVLIVNLQYVKESILKRFGFAILRKERAALSFLFDGELHHRPLLSFAAVPNWYATRERLKTYSSCLDFFTNFGRNFR